MDNGGPSAMGLYASAGGESNPADTGMAMGRSLYDAELAARSRYADPAVAPDNTNDALRTGAAKGRLTDPPEYYNYANPLPVKYAVPSAAKERMVAREAIRNNVPKRENNVLRTDPITDEEADYLQAMKDQAELADFDRYVNSLIDPRKPGNLKWLMEIYPDFVNRRIQQVHTDYTYALRGQMIDSWGINTFDDLHFKYLQDQGKIKGPYLQTNVTPGASYSAGILAPAAFKSERKEGVRLPFASARFGKSAGPDGSGWTMPDNDGTTGTGTLSGGRSMAAMAASMYSDTPTAFGSRGAPPGDWGQPRRATAVP